jgi:catechol 2,3-dioxygenase-like lactoylglutathione lyase family enzyme
MLISAPPGSPPAEGVDQRHFEVETTMTPPATSRRAFVARIGAIVAAPGSGAGVLAQERGTVSGFDHVALPMQNSDAMIAFYRRLGFQVRETPTIASVYIGSHMINFHRPALWQNPSFTLRAPAAKPPCGDLCFVWDGPPAALKQMLDRAGATIETGPADRQGGRQKTGSSVYVRDPDGNLLEFIIYP